MHTYAESKIYHWVDKDGNSHFSDTPAVGDEEVQLHEQNILVNQKVPKRETAPIETTEEEPAIEYQATIVSPADDEAIRSNEGTLNIHVSTSPAKKNSHKFQLYLDGKPLGQPQISPTIKAQNIDRGTHQLEVHLIDDDGGLLAKTQVITVHLQRVHLNRVQAVAR